MRVGRLLDACTIVGVAGWKTHQRNLRRDVESSRRNNRKGVLEKLLSSTSGDRT